MSRRRWLGGGPPRAQDKELELRTPGEGDFHACGGTWIRRPGRLDWACGFCGQPRPGPKVLVRLPDGRIAAATPSELEEAR